MGKNKTAFKAQHQGKIFPSWNLFSFSSGFASVFTFIYCVLEDNLVLSYHMGSED